MSSSSPGNWLREIPELPQQSQGEQAKLVTGHCVQTRLPLLDASNVNREAAVGTSGCNVGGRGLSYRTVARGVLLPVLGARLHGRHFLAARRGFRRAALIASVRL